MCLRNIRLNSTYLISDIRYLKLSLLSSKSKLSFLQLKRNSMVEDVTNKYLVYNNHYKNYPVQFQSTVVTVSFNKDAWVFQISYVQGILNILCL